MSMYPRLLGIAAVVFGFGLSQALPAGDVWRGFWKFEMDRGDNPMLVYYDTGGKTIFRIYCGTHFETDAVYPGAPKQDWTNVSITIANGKTQMDFAGFSDVGSDLTPPNAVMTPVMAPRARAVPRPVCYPVSDRPSENAMLMPAPTAVARPTNKAACDPERSAAAKIGASVERVPSIKPTSPG